MKVFCGSGAIRTVFEHGMPAVCRWPNVGDIICCLGGRVPLGPVVLHAHGVGRLVGSSGRDILRSARAKCFVLHKNLGDKEVRVTRPQLA